MRLLVRLIVVIVGLGAVWLARATREPERLPFERETWVAQRGLADSDLREQMLFDLLQNHLKHGATRAEIISLLGEPDGEEADRILYIVALGSDRPGDPPTLAIQLGPNGGLIAWKVRSPE